MVIAEYLGRATGDKEFAAAESGVEMIARMRVQSSTPRTVPLINHSTPLGRLCDIESV